jgi:large subunit ribosomal protein L22
MKRIRPAPMGRAYRYQRRLSHIVISVAERRTAGSAETSGEPGAAPARKRLARKPVKKAAAKSGGAKPKNWNKKPTSAK